MYKFSVKASIFLSCLAILASCDHHGKNRKRGPQAAAPVSTPGQVAEGTNPAQPDGAGSAQSADGDFIQREGGSAVDATTVPSAAVGLTLTVFNSCEDLERSLKQRIIKDLNYQLEVQLAALKDPKLVARPYPCTAEEPMDLSVPPIASDAVLSASAAAGRAEGMTEDMSMTFSGSGAAAPGTTTGTNNQVAGVEEGDIVKSDGTHIFHVAKGRLQISQSFPARQLRLLSSLPVVGQPIDLLWDDKERLILVVRADVKEIIPGPRPPVVSEPADSQIAGVLDRAVMPVYHSHVTKVLVYDVKDKSAPQLQHAYFIKGALVATRRIGSMVRLVVKDELRPAYPSLGKPAVTPVLSSAAALDAPVSSRVALADSAPAVAAAAQRAALEEQIKKNEELVGSKGLKDFLSNDTFYVTSEPSSHPQLDLENCGNISLPTYDTHLGLTRVVTLDLDTLKMRQNVLLADVNEVYASEKSLYLTTPYYNWSDVRPIGPLTVIHKFNIEAEAAAAYQGSGAVYGTLLNQFSMDEFKGHLRIAATQNAVDPRNMCVPLQINRVSVLRQEGNKLVTVGRSEPLAPRERIYSVRFMAERGFVVTFRQVDPLFALDLADPVNPLVKGALKIPGFSNYLQPIDANHLIGIGRNADESGRVQPGLKLSLFNVANLAEPQEVHAYTLPGVLNSEATYNHKAFTYYPEKRILALPVDWAGKTIAMDSLWWQRYQSQLMLLDIDPAVGIKKRGVVDVSDLYLPVPDLSQSDLLRPEPFMPVRVERALFADDVVYAITNMGIKGVSIDNLGQTLGIVRY
jgi:hypothetical protein